MATDSAIGYAERTMPPPVGRSDSFIGYTERTMAAPVPKGDSQIGFAQAVMVGRHLPAIVLRNGVLTRIRIITLSDLA